MSALSIDPADKARFARARFFDGKPVPPGLVPESVVQSWDRSKKLFARSDKMLFSNYVSRALARRIKDQRRDLLDACLPEMQHLCASLSDPNWLILCTDAEGVVVETVSMGRCSTPSSLLDPFQTGRVLRESEFGTNAPGCVLIEREQVVINRNEHFLDDVCPFVCAAVPIFDGRGELAGVMDVTSLSRSLNSAIVEMVAWAGRAAENRLISLHHTSCRIISLHHDQRLLGSPLEGVIVLSPDYRLIAANRVARAMLAVDSIPGSGVDLDTVFPECAQFRQKILKDDTFEFRITRPNGSTLFMRSQPDHSANERGRRTQDGAIRPFPSSRRTLVEQDDASDVDGPSTVLKDLGARECLDLAKRAVRIDLPVVIQGETGTGKEIIALALHRFRRTSGPFVPINCSSIPEGLIESELFGYADGAFTGGRKGGTAGKIAQANGGTLFLDEIGEMPLSLQTRLLRVLQDRSVTPIGASKSLPVDITLVCATHRDLDSMVREGHFRQDLYYRLCGISVALPALRERSDISDLIDFFLRAEALKGHSFSLSQQARSALVAYSWPGNIRQLQHTIRAMVATSEDAEISFAHLPAGIRNTTLQTEPDGGVRNDVRPTHLMAKVQLDLINKTLRDHGGNVSAAARSLGISRGTLYNRMRNR